MLRVDSEGFAGANGVAKGDYLVALNGRAVPSGMPDKDLAVSRAYIPYWQKRRGKHLILPTQLSTISKTSR